MKNPVLLFFVSVIVFHIIPITVIAQDCDCYNSTRSKGISLMQKKLYSKAIEYFKAADDCPDKPASNDLQAKRNECLQAIRQIEEERQRESELARKRVQEANYASKGYMEITDIKFANIKNDGTIIDDYGSTLYSSDLRYLKPKLFYNGLASEQKTIKLFCKIFRADGTLSKGDSSPEGYTSSSEYTIYPGTGKILNLTGWGTDNGGHYFPGTCKYELWYEGKLLFAKEILIKSNSGEVSYLKVDNKTVVSTSFYSSGGSETFTVSTDSDSWTIWGIPSWCSIENKSSNGFRLKCEPNSSSSERSDYMKIKAGDKEVRIDIKQFGGSINRTGNIVSATVDHNFSNDGVKGMRIHVKFDIQNCKSEDCSCIAYFYYDNGSKLINNSVPSNYQVSDGHVSTRTDFTPGYDNTSYSDLILFIPNSAIVQSDHKDYYLKVRLYNFVTTEFIENTSYKVAYSSN